MSVHSSTPRRQHRRSSARLRWFCRGCASPDGAFQLGQTAWLRLLDIAEARVALEVVIEGTLPCVVVGEAPHAVVFGRAGIGEERHRLVGPYAVLLQFLAPARDDFGVVALRHDQ